MRVIESANKPVRGSEIAAVTGLTRKSVEDALVEEYPTVLAEAAKLYEEDPAKAAEYLTNYTVEKQEKALADCDTMYDELTWYMIANTSTLRYNSSRGEFNTWNNFVPSLAAE